MGREKKDSAPSSSLLATLEPICNFVPSVAPPKNQLKTTHKILWSLATLIIYLIACQIPVFGIRALEGSDPLFWLRAILASNRGSIMELGISPIMTSSMILNLMTGLRIIQIDQNNKRDTKIFDALQKLSGLAVTFIEATLYVGSGMYGDIRAIGIIAATLIVVQLFIGGAIVLLLDELLQVGWGLGSGISLFTSTGICETILWKTFSPSTLQTPSGPQYEGAIINAFSQFFMQRDKRRAVKEAFYRPYLPNLNNLLATILVFFCVVYIQNFRVNLTLSHKKGGGKSSYPIKLLYTSNTPLILVTSLTSQILMISQVLARRFGNNIIISLLGKWEESEYTGGQSVPIGGLVYYLTPPNSLSDMFNDPIHFVFYVVFMLGSCAYFSKIWIYVNGTSARDVARQLSANDMTLAGFRDESVVRHLEKYINVAAALGGVAIASLTILADFLGAIGSGTGILLATTMIYDYFQVLQKESFDINELQNEFSLE